MKIYDNKFRSFGLLFLLVISLISPVSAEPSTVREKISIKVEDKLISAEIDDSSLGDILDKISQQIDIKYNIPVSSFHHNVSVRFQKLRPLEAIARILKGHNYVVLSKRRENSSDKVNVTHEIRLYVLTSYTSERKTVASSRGTESGPMTPPASSKRHSNFSPTSVTDNPIVEDIDHTGLGDKIPVRRVRALEALVSEHDTDALPIMLGALMDEEPDVRIAVLDMVRDKNIGEIPRDTLNRLSLSDDDSEVRTLAKALLAERYEDDGIERPPEVASLGADHAEPPNY